MKAWRLHLHGGLFDGGVYPGTGEIPSLLSIPVGVPDTPLRQTCAHYQPSKPLKWHNDALEFKYCGTSEVLVTPAHPE